mmetsp:Transcript_21315/g.25664  ORF Transcript_21315/g.25664 Transcript_21315/m.25664 type:complete len:466 (-) Transcript_21315:639-2036(-)|eukprot:CAMPEP_0197848332 /NCGR_PEP_ID=MMETSP1438-20131217/8344_1 /TAXON_ID=1461541 /ORGANISM="Pterosperma sp., Strain CCMP1384" /LENGTH=465 /DNA_ID=CAMNT_0043460515 /DNA_START=100 /DNA_END=1497 /DNA_ORIENTATION=+
MESIYYTTFGVFFVLCSGLELSNRQHSKNNAESSVAKGPADKLYQTFLSFRNNYLVVYSLMMAGDWLQGPYVYALYSHYGYSKGDIGKLFIAGFGSSMIFGTIVGSLADKYGRKKMALCYVITYVLSCATKHSPDYYVLMLGRFFGGIATSLLFSAFESWLVAEHFKRGFEDQWLSMTFSKAIFLGNGLVAIVSGLLANYLVHDADLGPVIPFDAAAFFLAIGGAIVWCTWSENYGDQTESTTVMEQFARAANSIKSDKKIFLLGAMQSLFEGSMYTFVFLWTPALSPNGEDIPHGFIFATFMLACMTGSSIAARLMSQSKPCVEEYMQYVFVAAALGLLIPVYYTSVEGENLTEVTGISFEGKVQFIGFLIFEVCVGVFWPSIMSMRSKYIPEESRSTIMNFFRMPLNLFVCIVLYNVSMFPLATMFAMCSTFLLVAAFCQYQLLQVAQTTGLLTPLDKEDSSL